MGSIVTIHSYRGGTGKSNVSANLAAATALAGKRVAVIDTDIQSPGINLIFGFKQSDLRLTLNDYLGGKCGIRECAYDVSTRTRVPPGQLFLIPSSLQYMEIAKILKSGFDLNRMVEGFRQIITELSLDLLFVDTHPGLGEETMLYTVMSKLLVVLLRPDQQDYLGTGVVVEVAKKLGVPQIGLVVNKVLPQYRPEDVAAKIGAQYQAKVIGMLPFDAGVMANESAQVMVIAQPEHPWSLAVKRLSAQVQELTR